MILPKRLGIQPLIDATFEVRFEPQGAVADLLPGIVFSKLKDDYNRSEVLPLASVPSELRKKEPQFHYAAYQRLHGPESVVFFGDRVVGVSRLAPYAGWDRFRERILRLIDVVEESDLVRALERFSIKATNILPPLTERQLDMLQIEARISGQDLPDQGFRLRSELNDTGIVRIVEIIPNASARGREGSVVEGLQLSIDCIRLLDVTTATWQELRDGLDEIHLEQKSLFFSMITSETLEALEPTYE